MQNTIINDIFEKMPLVEGKRLFVFGTGNTALLYQEGFSRIGLNFEGYVCNFKAGQQFLGKKVYSPLEVSKMDNVCVLLCLAKVTDCLVVGSQLTELGVVWCHIDEYIWSLHKKEVETVYNLLEDETSKTLYCKLLHCRTKCELPDTDMFSPSIYFALPPFRYSDNTEVFVDCGAFVGDTLEKYIWQCDGVFKKLIAFERDTGSFLAMQHRVERLKPEWNISQEKIEIYPYAVSEQENISYLHHAQNNGLGTCVVGNECENTVECRTINIDSFIKERYTFLKADMESYEYKMLLGARESIRKWKPKLAICIYHSAVDFYSIPLLVKKINPEYKLAIRHHSLADLFDTVLYAWM